MKVYKFGGASVKSAKAVRNVQKIISENNNTPLFVVVSAMGKTTNALENIVHSLYSHDMKKFKELVEERRSFHLQIVKELFQDKNHAIFQEVNAVFQQLLDYKEDRLVENNDFQYDQIVSLGEILATKIIAAYLKANNFPVAWKDARTFIRTNNKYRNGKVDWEKTQELIGDNLATTTAPIIVTQGFIGHTDEGFSTTLGREGSDFTAAIVAYCTNAESVTIWKDVPGMLNADPKWFKDTIKLDKISFREAIELAYFGASVIHPKTIKPLQNKNIPLYIKSFLSPEDSGSIIQESTKDDNKIPSFIFKTNQVLLSVIPKDFSFVIEENLRDIFQIFTHSGAHINLMQNSAVSFAVCIDIEDFELQKLVHQLEEEYDVKYNKGLELVTIRHFDQETINQVTKGKEILMEQKTKNTARMVMRKKVFPKEIV